MSTSLYGTLNSALNAMQVQQAAVETTTANIANSNTTGYSRRRAVLEEAAPNADGTPGGVTLARVESLRDTVLDMRIQEETQQQAASDAVTSALQPVQLLFESGSNSIGDEMTSFFSSLQDLSSSPTDTTVRKSVLTSASSLASAFNTASAEITATRQTLGLDLTQAVSGVNTDLKQIAALNVQIQSVQAEKGDASDLIDQRSQLITDLSGKMNVTQFSDSEGLTLTTKDGTALVTGGQNYAITAQTDPATNDVHIYSGANDITSEITGGSMGGDITARDSVLSDLQSQLDTLASGLGTALNTANASGYDLNGDAGASLFSFTSGTGAAASIKLATTDGALIAASSDTSTGGSGNVANLLGVQNQTVVSGKTPLDAYSSVVYSIGSKISDAEAASSASGTILQQLQDQQSAVSGVDVDEEVTNLILYQRAYQASARVISVVDSMLQTAINMIQ